jgi:outer membrane protein assembly factor BamB
MIKGWSPKKQRKVYLWAIAAILTFSVVVLQYAIIGSRATPAHAAHGTEGDWPAYMGSYARHGFNKFETIINPTSASNLKLHWSYAGSSRISSQPVEANGMVYWGSWNGYEHAMNLSGQQVWQTYLGHKAPCNSSSINPNSSSTLGVGAAASIASIMFNGTMTPTVFVGGGDGYFYALNASTGAIIWKTLLGSSAQHYIWSSSVLYKGSVYIDMIGIAEDIPSTCQKAPGELFQLDATSGSIQHSLSLVPSTCSGSNVWGSPALDVGAGNIYFPTGNSVVCTSSEPYANSLVEVRASDLTIVSSWQVPASEQIKDGDFGSTPTLFSATINGVLRYLVGLANKNGIYYALDRTNLSAGPVWEDRIAIPGSGPEVGQGSISSSAWDGSTLYVAGGNTTINGTSCLGGLRAVDPASGALVWEHCLIDGFVLGAVTVVPGVAVVGAGPDVDVIATTSGATLASLVDSNSGSSFDGPASISNGVLYIGNRDGNLYAYGT